MTTTGKDKIIGGNGNDYIDGGTGADKLTGGLGSDTFFIGNIAIDGFDTITDFSEDDQLMFDTSVFSQLVGSTAENLTFGKIALDENDYLIYDMTQGALFYDNDGSGNSSQAIKILGIKGADSHALTFDDMVFL